MKQKILDNEPTTLVISETHCPFLARGGGRLQDHYPDVERVRPYMPPNPGRGIVHKKYYSPQPLKNGCGFLLVRQ